MDDDEWYGESEEDEMESVDLTELSLKKEKKDLAVNQPTGTQMRIKKRASGSDQFVFMDQKTLSKSKTKGKKEANQLISPTITMKLAELVPSRQTTTRPQTKKKFEEPKSSVEVDYNRPF